MSNGYPPPQQPGQPPQWQGQQPGWGAPMPPPKKTNKAGLFAILGCSGVLVLAVIGGVVAIASSGGGSSDDAEASSVKSSPSATASASGKAPAKEKTAPAPKGAEGDVKITGCAVNASTTWPAADVEIVNHSSSRANYIVSVEFVDASGTRLGEGMAATNNLAPGQKARAKAQGLAETSGKITCKVSKVTRYPAG